MVKIIFKQFPRSPINFRRHIPPTSSSSKEEAFTEQRAGLLSENEKLPGVSKSYRSMLCLVVRGIFMALGAFLVVYVGQWMVISRIGLRSDHPTPNSQFFDLVIPVDEASQLEVCQSILTAQVLNYPLPTLVTWEAASEGPTKSPEEQLLARFTQVYAILNATTPDNEEALVLLLDAPGTWFQLRPDVLLHRYYRIIRRANQRLATKLGTGIKQTVLFAAQSSCAFNQDTEVACYAVPESPLSSGSQQRFPGHGAILGPLKDVRAIIERAVEKLRDTALPDPLAVFGEIFGEQEYERAILQHGQGWGDWFRSGEDKRRKMQTQSNTTYEFGIGLDYENELGSRMEDLKWEARETLPAEIEASMSPYWTVSGAESDLPHDSSWSDVRLLTTADSGVIPAMVHRCPVTFNKDTECAASNAANWTRLWLHPHARTLYTATQRLPASMVASVVDAHGREQRFWNRQHPMLKAGAWTADGEWNHWQDLCGGEATWKAVFQDEKGAWTATEY